MARQARIEFEGAFHHVMSRGNDDIFIFRDDEDRRLFIELLAEEVIRSRWVLHDYCLMGTHFHLAIATPECTLSTGMHRLLARYAQRFNRRHRRRGHLFQNRFKSVLVEQESHGLVLSRYLALNPVKARICGRPEEWRWSSYAARAGLAEAPQWLSVEPLAAQFGTALVSRQRAYREFVLGGAGIPDDVVENPIAGLFLGTASWLERMQEIVDRVERSGEHPRAQVHPGRPDLPAVMEAVAQTFDMTVEEITTRRGGLARRLVACLAFEDGLIPLGRIARALGLTSASHASTLAAQGRREVTHDPEVGELVEACRGRMKRCPPPFLMARSAGFAAARRYHRADPRSRRR